MNCTIKRLCVDGDNEIETRNKQTIIDEIRNFYKKLYSTATDETPESCSQFLENINLPTLTAQEINFLNQPITKEDLKASIKKSKNGKSQGF